MKSQVAASSAILEFANYPNVSSHPRIALYRDTLKKRFNVSVKKFPQSNESLIKRVVKSGSTLPSINPIVDFYNSISIKHAVTAGAFDLGELKAHSEAPLELRRGAAAKDTFLALNAPADSKPDCITDGELLYVQGTTVLTRHLAWRQSSQALVSDVTKDVVFVSEILNDKPQLGSSDLARRVAREFTVGLKEFFGVESKFEILGEGLLSADL